MPPPISTHELSFAYAPGKPVLQSISLSLDPGKLYVLIGPNAAGKSTLLKLILGQLTPTTGSAKLTGLEASSLPPKQRAAIASYVPQRTALASTFTVEQVVAMGRFALPHNPQIIDQTLHQCDLSDLRNAVYAHLSAGQQQRVLLARALAQSAPTGKAILLDEPGSAMDLWHSHQTMLLLQAAANSGLCVLVVLHDLNLAARYADHVLLLHQTRLAAQGPWQSVLTPQILEPIYQVPLHQLTSPQSTRPIFSVGQINPPNHAPRPAT